ncbi:Bodo-specific multi-copy gene family, putative [Bodo saltans]|uniref:Bodo-specific multi-copy gene family, putative n=1 Tax=Bodo saltans TaxID=75058 RepID=A0A0S4IHC8_BODSA|nr:Bodo-specific multi-copy gene family, putative [Bodo saltans]|eukprot:CUE63759.1 Bodo-specific multi-copy gene family, putative [Bodo saltans]
MAQRLKAMGFDVPILPSELHPFVDANIVARFGALAIAERWEIFTKAFSNAVFARYLLACWESGTCCLWASLAKVFEGAVQQRQIPLLERYEVNISEGVRKKVKRQAHIENAVTYELKGSVPKVHIWCRDKQQQSVEFAVPLHFHNCPPHTTSRKQVPRLIVVGEPADVVYVIPDDVIINADAMSSTCCFRPCVNAS